MKTNDFMFFPCTSEQDAAGYGGVTFRDVLATHAMQALIPTIRCPDDAKKIVEASYLVADAMLEERLK